MSKCARNTANTASVAIHFFFHFVRPAICCVEPVNNRHTTSNNNCVDSIVDAKQNARQKSTTTQTRFVCRVHKWWNIRDSMRWFERRIDPADALARMQMPAIKGFRIDGCSIICLEVIKVKAFVADEINKFLKHRTKNHSLVKLTVVK